ncbi:MAG: EAL domain-containing protein [Sphingobacteriia bacterium]|nr:EAL domain-containing protein [Sphingobacteriia bacterium]
MAVFLREDAERDLMRYVIDVSKRPKGHTAIHFHFSNLTNSYKTKYHLKIALNLISEHFAPFESATFALENFDVVVIVFTTKSEIIDRVIFHLRYLFIDDPLSNKKGFGDDNFCSLYFLNYEMKKFIESCNDLVSDYKEKIKHHKSLKVKEDIHITSDVIRDIENKIFKLDVSKYLRKQTVVTFNNNNLKNVFQEVYISLGHFKQILEEKISGCSERIINQFVFEKLDLLVLKHIKKKEEDFIKSPISLNLNIKTVIEDEFVNFIEAIPDHYKSSLIIEFQLADMFYDMQAFKTAKEFLNKNNIKICLDGVNNFSFIQIDRESLGVDLIKLQWNSDIAKNLDRIENQRLVDLVKKAGPEKIILTRCDDEKAIKYGKVLGVKMYQGWYIDRLLMQ